MMPPGAGLAVLLLAGVLAACEAAAPSPLSRPHEASPSPARPSPVPASPMTPVTASPPATGRPTPAAGGWLYLADFPADGALEVTSVVDWADGFVALGFEPAPGEGFGGRRDGILWTSSDGLSWQRHQPAEFANTTLLHVVRMGGELFAFGEHSICPEFAEADECEDVPQAGIAAWRSSDAVSWQRLALPDSLRLAILDGLIAGSEEIVAYGSTGEDLIARFWSSRDGELWQEAGDLGPVDPVSTLALGPERMVAFGTRYIPAEDDIEALAAYSDGGGFLPGQLPADQRGGLLSVTWGPTGFVAVGDGPLTAPGIQPVVLVSGDGISWEAAATDDFPPNTGLREVLSLPSGYLCLGAMHSAGGSDIESVRAWSSGDGLFWTEQGELSGGSIRQLSSAALGSPGIVVFGTDFDETDDEEPLGSDAGTVHAWFVPATSLP